MEEVFILILWGTILFEKDRIVASVGFNVKFIFISFCSRRSVYMLFPLKF